VGADESGPAGD